jgi:hypothetical protein
MAAASAGGAPFGNRDRLLRGGDIAYLDVAADRRREDPHLLGDREHLLAGEHVLLPQVAVLGQRERGDRGDVGGVDRGVAAGADRVEYVAALVDGGQPVERVGHEAAGPQEGRGDAGRADDLLALVVPAAHGGHRVAEDVERGQVDDPAHPGVAGGGDRGGGVVEADAGGEQEEGVGAFERAGQGGGVVEVADDAFRALREAGRAGRVADEKSHVGAPRVEFGRQFAADVPGGSGDE